MPLIENDRISNHSNPEANLREGATINDLKKYLNSAAISILHRLTDTPFVNDLYTEAGDTIDGDYNALFYKLNENSIGLLLTDLKNNYANNLTIASNAIKNSMRSEVDDFSGSYFTTNSFLDDVVNGISSNGETYYPQIFVSNYETIDKNSYSSPTVAVSLYDNEYVFGYKFNSLNQLEIVELDTGYFSNNLVWGITLNEVITSYQDIVYLDTSISKVIYSETGVGPDTAVARDPCDGYSPKKGDIREIKIWKRLDHPISGKAEVYVQYVHSHRATGIATDQIRLIRNKKLKHSKKHIGKWQRTTFLRLDRPGDYIGCDEVVDFIIYEKDPWWQPKRTYQHTFYGNLGSCSSVLAKRTVTLKPSEYNSREDNYYTAGKDELCGLDYHSIVINRDYFWGSNRINKAGEAKLYFTH